MPIRVLIVDDEPPARDELAYLLSEFSDIEVVAQAGSAREACEQVMAHGPDLVFLDIEMPGGSGFDVVATTLDMEDAPLIIFATAFDQYAIRAFEENAVDYLLKPVTEDRLSKSLARAREALSAREPRDKARASLEQLLAGVGTPQFSRIPVERNGRIALLKPDEVVFCASESRKLMIHTTNEAWPCHGICTMDALEQRLGSGSFFRAGRGVLVNLERIREFSPWFNGKYNLVLDDAEGTELAVSRGRVQYFKERLGL
ncbi:LytR/AlgR family response regulator transcription factor [Desulfovibrio ferrophilus]|uniref:Two component transcriptional regulator, LytTR family n=1 Tax=Desulfovibrio ferrophilus TaxID=241368 RepID=A0A2Z6AUH4_9BACT|nr:response regulator [Desulfovibrio ferrophilus]BBD06845.1 two component transcriptional regulator, LytTR family [Desulfovibrio ferrophilus]